jgi:hypothetical protein
MSVFQLSAKEIYDAYIGDTTPPELLQKDRYEIATRLQVEEGLKEEASVYAADQMLAYARQLVELEA